MDDFEPLMKRPQLLIRASAGAGKTYRLTQHYLELLRRGADVAEILATTFTRKAAGEILGRLVRTLCEQADAEARGEACAWNGEGLKTSRVLLSEATDNLHRMGVATIDGFFHRLGNSFQFELGLPLVPRLIEEGSPEAAALRGEAIEQVLADAAVDDTTFRAMLDLLRRLHHDSASRSVTRAIDNIVVQHAEVYREAPWPETWTTLKPEGLLSGGELDEVLTGWRSLEDELPQTKAGKPRALWVKSWQKTTEHAQAGDWDGVVANGILAKLFVGETVFGGAEIEGGWAEWGQRWCRHARSVIVERIARQTAAAHELMRHFALVYEKLRDQRGVMLYSDMAHRLAGGPFAGRDVRDQQVLAEMYFRLDAAVTHLLLDEFQDTSLDQWQVLSPFVEEIGSTGDGSRSLFVVGDTKQAIYGWRGGCVELFDHVPDYAPMIQRESLAKSYRSSQVVLDAVNAVFSDLSRCEAFHSEKHPVDADAAAAWSAAFETHVAHHQDLTGYVCFEASPVVEDVPSPAEHDAEDVWAPADSHERFVAQRIGEIYGQAKSSGAAGCTIGVLARGNKMVSRLLYELKRAGLPASGEGGNPIADAPAVAAVLSALTVADHPGDGAAAFHTLNSPLAEVLGMDSRHATQRVSKQIRHDVIQQGLAATVAGWVQQLGPACDAADLAKLTRLVELAEQYESAGRDDAEALRLKRFVDFVEGTKVEEPEPSPIRVMTIHRSKGLEFDAVVLPELDSPLGNRFGYLVDRPDPTGPIEAVFRGVNESNRSVDDALLRAYAQRRARQRQEDLCTLYVAMTRAKRALHLIAKPGFKPDGKPRRAGLSFAGILRSTLGDPDAGCAWGDADWLASDPGASADDASTQTPDSAGSSEVLSARLDSGQPATRLRPAVAPSQLHGGGRVQARDLLALETSAAMRRGSAIHAGLETIAYLDDGPPPESLAHLFEHHAVRAAFTQRYENETLWRERGFAVVDGDRLLRGVFDRVVIERDARGNALGAHVIDFKSDRIDPEDASVLQDRVETYRPQIEAYRRALSLMLGLDASAVTAELLFLSAATSVRL